MNVTRHHSSSEGKDWADGDNDDVDVGSVGSHQELVVLVAFGPEASSVAH